MDFVVNSISKCSDDYDEVVQLQVSARLISDDLAHITPR